MTILKIRNAIEAGLNTITPLLNTAWENQKFSPPVSSVPYQKITLMEFTAENPTMGGTYHRINSYFQIDLCYPLGLGTSAMATQAELIKAKFKRTASFTSSSVVVVVTHDPTVGTGYVDGDRFVVPIKVRYYAEIFS